MAPYDRGMRISARQKIQEGRVVKKYRRYHLIEIDYVPGVGPPK